MCVTDRNDMTLAVKMEFNPNTTKQRSKGKNWHKISYVNINLKVAIQILRGKFYNNTKISSLYSQSPLIFIHKTLTVEHHPKKKTGEMRELLWPRSTPMGITVYFYMSSSLIYIPEVQRRKFQPLHLMKTLCKIITVMLWNLKVISHLIFPQSLLLFLAQNLKITKRLRCLLREHHKKYIYFLDL